MLDNPGTRASVIALPIWVGFMWLCYRLQLRLQVRTKEAV
jgi:aromatic amino acid transport protein AroP